MAKKQNPDKAQLDLLRDAQSISKQMGVSEENIAQLQQSVLDGRVKSYNMLLKELKVLQEITAVEKEATKLQAEQEKLAAEQLKTETRRKQITKDTVSLDSELAKISKNLERSSYKIAAMSNDELDLTKGIIAAKREELEILRESGLADQAELAGLSATLSNMDGIIDAAVNLREKFGMSAETLQDINEGFDKLQSKINDLTSFLPKGLSSALGIDTMAEDLQASAMEGKALPKALGFVAVAAVLVAASAVLSEITKKSQEFATQTGLTVSASQKLVEQSYEVETSYTNQLSSQEDILGVQQEIISQLGPIAQLSGDVALRVSETGKAFGYGAQEAAKVQSLMMGIGGFSQTAAIEAQEFTAQLALAEGVAPGAVMKDIAKSAAVAAKYFSNNPKALGKAAVEAAKLGTSLDQMAKTSAALLNIEQSLEDQYVASAMLGRQINFDTARRLSAEGDIVGATQEVLKELGGIEEFENASIFAKERMAAAAGMTVEELSKSLAIEARRGELSDDQLAAMSGLNLTTAEITSMNADDLKTKLANQQATDELSESMDKIASAMKTTILPIAQLLAPIFSTIAQVVGYIVEGFQTLQPILPLILTAIAAIKAQAILTAVASAITTAYKTFSSVPYVGYALATAAALGAVGFIKGATKVNDAEMSPIGPSGYSRVMSGPEGSIAFNDDDTIVAGTDLNGGGGGSGTSVISKASIDALVSAIQNLKIIIDDSAVSAINKQGAVAASYR